MFEPRATDRASARTTAGSAPTCLLGASVFSVQDKIPRSRLHQEHGPIRQRFLPTGDRASRWPIAVFFYIGDQLEWEVELAIPAGAVEPTRLGAIRAARLDQLDGAELVDETDRAPIARDARFHPARNSHGSGSAAQRPDDTHSEERADGRYQSRGSHRQTQPRRL